MPHRNFTALTLQPRHSAPANVRARVVVALVVLALVLAQALGLVHRMAHAPHGELQPPALSHAHADDAPALQDHYIHDHHTQDHQHSDASLTRLFGGHAADTDCRLYDHFSHADALPTLPLVVLPLGWFGVVGCVAFARLELAPQRAPCQARAPPAALIC